MTDVLAQQPPCSGLIPRDDRLHDRHVLLITLGQGGRITAYPALEYEQKKVVPLQVGL